jgi:hypothetical protein
MEDKFTKSKALTEVQFKRLIGVKKQTFEEMIAILREEYSKKHQKRGRHSNLTLELQLFMTLEYFRQYITFAELGFEYGVCESTAQNYVVWVEKTLIKCGKFSLPGKKALLEDTEIEVILVDVTECPIERPKKNSENIIQEKRKNTP